MTTGALIFAFNNEKTDYVALAAWSAANIHRHLDIPVALLEVIFDVAVVVATVGPAAVDDDGLELVDDLVGVHLLRLRFLCVF